MSYTENSQSSLIRALARIAPVCIALTIILGSVLVGNGMWFDYVNAKMFIIIGGGTLVLACAILTFSKDSFKEMLRSRMAIAVLIFLGATLLSTVFSVDRTLSWLGNPERATATLLVVSLGCGTLASSFFIVGKKKIATYLLYPVVIAGTIVALSVTLGTGGFGLLHGTVITSASGGGLIGNSSFAGVFLMMSFFITLYLFLSSRSRNAKIFIGSMGAIILLNPTLVGFPFLLGKAHGGLAFLGAARGSSIALILGLAVSGSIALFTTSSRTKKWLGGVLLGAILVATVGSIILLVTPTSRVHKIFVEQATGTRFIYWDIALRSWKDHPILGSGPETYRYSYEKYFNSDMMLAAYNRELWSDKPHNIYLEYLTTEGIVGLAAYLLLLVSIVIAAIRIYKKSGDRWLLVIVAGLLYAYMLGNVIFFDTTTSYLLFFTVAAWLVARERQLVSANTTVTNHSLDGAGALIAKGVLALASIVYISTIVFGQYKKLHTAFLESGSQLEDRMMMYSQVESYSPYGSGIFLAVRADTYSQTYQAHIDEIVAEDGKSKQVIIADLHAMSQVLVNSLAKYPVTTQSTLTLGRLGSLAIAIENKLDIDALKQMTDAANRTIAISPTTPQGYWLLGQTYIYEKKYDDALAAFEQALAINPRIPESHQIIINLAILTHNSSLLESARARALADTGLTFTDSSIPK